MIVIVRLATVPATHSFYRQNQFFIVIPAKAGIHLPYCRSYILINYANSITLESLLQAEILECSENSPISPFAKRRKYAGITRVLQSSLFFLENSTFFGFSFPLSCNIWP